MGSIQVQLIASFPNKLRKHNSFVLHDFSAWLYTTYIPPNYKQWDQLWLFSNFSIDLDLSIDKRRHNKNLRSCKRRHEGQYCHLLHFTNAFQRIVIYSSMEFSVIDGHWFKPSHLKKRSMTPCHFHVPVLQHLSRKMFQITQH